MNRFPLRTKSKLIFAIISVLLTFYLALPIIIHRTDGIFFELDPDAHYIGNAISYIKLKKISYINHPATPTIVSYAIVLTPIRIFTKLILHENFVIWYIKHPEIIYLYLRLFQSLIFGIGLFIFSLSIHKLTKSIALSVLAIFLLFTFSFTIDLALHIRSETTSFLIISFWLYFFANRFESVNLKDIIILSIVSGLAVANKFTNFFYVIATLTLIPLIKNMSLTKKLSTIFFGFVISFISFIFFTWPIHDRYNQIFQYTINLFPQSGVWTTRNSLLDPRIYLQSLSTLFLKEYWASVITILTVIIALYFFIKKKNKISSSLYFFLLVITLGIFIFARYPLNYYQLTHFLGIIFVLSYLLKQIPKSLLILLSSISFLIVTNHLIEYYPQSSYTINQSYVLDRYISSHPSTKGTIWERGDAKDFALLWGNSWSGASYSTDLKQLRPDLLFEIYFQQNYIGDKRDIFRYCWDKFYMQKGYFDSFTKKYKNMHFLYTKIPETDMYVIERDNC